MSKFYLYYSFVSMISFLFASVVFFSVYKSVDGGLWAAFASSVAGVCFHLYRLYFENKLQSFFTLRGLDYLSVLSVLVCLIGAVFGVWYAFVIVYWKIPLTDYRKPLIFPCVFSFLSAKWGFHLHRATKKCISEFMTSNYSPLIQDI